MQVIRVSAVFLIVFLLASCSSEPNKTSSGTGQPPASAAPKPSFYTGREAITKLYIAARSWAVDSKPFRLESVPTKESNGQDGKSGIWRASFGSPVRKSVRSFTWTGIKTEDAPEPGISANPEDFSYNSENSSTKVFEIVFLKTDSDHAAEEAAKHGGDKILKQDPEMFVTYVLDWDPRRNQALWRVNYGPNHNEPKFAATVDATTGLFQRVER